MRRHRGGLWVALSQAGELKARTAGFHWSCAQRSGLGLRSFLSLSVIPGFAG
jgi:hypothetical protein